MTPELERAARFVDHVERDYAAGRGWALEKRRGDHAIIVRGTREDRRRLIATRHFEWTRWSEMELRHDSSRTA
jgi:hypothetical protein